MRKAAEALQTDSHLEGFMHHLVLRSQMFPPRVSHITRHLEFLLLKDLKNTRTSSLVFTEKVTFTLNPLMQKYLF